MYKVKFLKTKRFIDNGEVFFTYERARQAARKHVRKMVKKGTLSKHSPLLGLWDNISRNPGMLSQFYAIMRMD